MVSTPGTVPHDRRAISPVIGVILLVAITVVLASVVGALVFGQSGESAAPHAAFEAAVDVDDDAIKLTHASGDRLFADRTRFVWTIDGERFTLDATDSHTGLASGQSVTFQFDGSSQSTGRWTSYPSPGSVDIQAADEIDLTVYDTRSNKPVFENTFAASGNRADLGGGGGSGDLLWLGDQTAGATDVTMHVEFTIQSGSSTVGNSLDSVEIDMDDSSLTMFSGTGWSDVTTAGVDTDGDGSVDVDLFSDSDDWIVSEGGSHLKIEFGGAAYTNVQAGDTIIISFSGVDNPPVGVYAGDVQTSGDGNYQHDTVETK